MSNMMLGIFKNKNEAEDAIRLLKENDYNTKDVSVIMKDEKEGREMASDTGANVGKGAVSGVATGAVVGGIAGFLAGTTVPVLGGFLIAGPVGAALGLTGAAATTVSGVATGAVAGGLIGALTGLGLSGEKAKEYEHDIKNGAILIAVSTREGEEEEAQRLLDEAGATDVVAVPQGSGRAAM